MARIAPLPDALSELLRRPVGEVLVDLLTRRPQEAPQTPAEPEAGEEEPERLLTVQEAAARLSVRPDWIYRHARELPFAVRFGRFIRFSQSGLNRWIRSRNRA